MGADCQLEETITPQLTYVNFGLIQGLEACDLIWLQTDARSYELLLVPRDSQSAVGAEGASNDMTT